MNKIIRFYRRLMMILLASVVVGMVAGSGGLALAANEDPCDISPKPEYCQAAEDADGKDPATETIQRVTTLVAFIAGFLAVFWIIIMGIKYQTSYGDPEKTKAARKGIIYAVVGLIVVVAAQLLILVVLKIIE